MVGGYWDGLEQIGRKILGLIKSDREIHSLYMIGRYLDGLEQIPIGRYLGRLEQIPREILGRLEQIRRG